MGPADDVRASRCFGYATRRKFLRLSTGAIALSSFASSGSFSQIERKSHGLSAFDDLGYRFDFQHFTYVNPKAPKGGVMSLVAGGGGATFNSTNAYILKGEPALGMDTTFASLMARAFDEPDAVYVYAAESVSVSIDRCEFRYLLREGISFHDGSQIIADDVAFSFAILKAKGHPNIQSILRDLENVRAIDDRTIILQFASGRARDAPVLAATLPIFSRKYYLNHDFEETTLEAPLGSGPYQVSNLVSGRFIEFERIRNWWGDQLPVMRGQHNFDKVRYEYFRDRDIAFEAFAAKTYLFREEFTSRIWATRYDSLPAVRDEKIRRENLPDGRPSGAQGWMINTRRKKFQDRNLREALNLAFDFEWTNRNILYSSYERTHSYFQNSDLAASGRPSQAEIELLAPFRTALPEAVFGEPVKPPVSNGSGQDRDLLRRAAELLSLAGWLLRDGKRRNANGELLSVELLYFEATTESQHSVFAKNLAFLGINPILSRVDAVQYHRRVNEFDFDLAVGRLIFDPLPGESLRNYFSSEAASRVGSFNYSGISDPAIDALIDAALTAETREAAITACRALDRVLLAGRYWIPQWFKSVHWIAYWDVFGHPKVKPPFARGAPAIWWYDDEKASK